MVSEINTEAVYKEIKKQNGEKFAKVLREYVLLDTPNLKHILQYAGKNSEDAKNLVPVLKEIHNRSTRTRPTQRTIKDPIELLHDAGYDAFVVENERQKNSIKKYFRLGEELCTFNDPKRHENYFMIHAVKHNAKNIKPAKIPQREDEYGTSVISIQIAKEGGFISIKNRYNHTVNNPDATFHNNPDNIILGLTESLQKYFGVTFMTYRAKIPDNYQMFGDQLVHFNYEIDNIYFDEKYYFSGAKVIELNPDYETMLDFVVLDTRNSTVTKIESSEDPLADIIQSEIKKQKIKVEKDKNSGETIIFITDKNKNTKEFARTKNGMITSLHLYKTKKISDCFLRFNTLLHTLEIPNVENIGFACFESNSNLKELKAPKLKVLDGENFMSNEILDTLYIPELEIMGTCFENNTGLTEFHAPKLTGMSDMCFGRNTKIKTIYIPKLKDMSDNCFKCNTGLKQFIAPNLETIGWDCFAFNKNLETIYMPKIEEIRSCFMEVKRLKELYVPKLKISEYTPVCIKRYLKLQKIKDAIKRILHINSGQYKQTLSTKSGKGSR